VGQKMGQIPGCPTCPIRGVGQMPPPVGQIRQNVGQRYLSHRLSHRLSHSNHQCLCGYFDFMGHVLRKTPRERGLVPLLSHCLSRCPAVRCVMPSSTLKVYIAEFTIAFKTLAISISWDKLFLSHSLSHDQPKYTRTAEIDRRTHQNSHRKPILAEVVRMLFLLPWDKLFLSHSLSHASVCCLSTHPGAPSSA